MHVLSVRLAWDDFGVMLLLMCKNDFAVETSSWLEFKLTHPTMSFQSFCTHKLCGHDCLGNKVVCLFTHFVRSIIDHCEGASIADMMNEIRCDFLCVIDFNDASKVSLELNLSPSLLDGFK